MGSWPSSASPIAMRIFSQNCRGLGKLFAVLQCQKNALKSKAGLIFLMETRLVKDRGKPIWEKCGFFECQELPREGFSRGLLLAWMPRQQVRIIYESKNLVHIKLLDNKGDPLPITFVYGHPNHSKREEVCVKLRVRKDFLTWNKEV